MIQLTGLKFTLSPKSHQIVNERLAQAVSDALDDWLRPVLLPLMMEASPVDEIPEDPFPGALRSSHFVSKGRGTNRIEVRFGIRVTDETVANSVSANRPEGFFYGMWLHETDGWSPRSSVGGLVGPQWIIRMQKRATPILKDLIRENLGRRRTFGFITAKITEYVATGAEA